MIDRPQWTSPKEPPEAPTGTNGHRRAGGGMEGPWAKLSAMTGVANVLIAIVSLLLAYIVAASQLHWPPFARPMIQRPSISSRSQIPSPTPKSSNAGPASPSSPTAPFRLMAVGTCIDLPPDGGSGMTAVSCAYPHDAELDSIRKAPSNNYPGPTVLSNQTNSWCESNFNQLTTSAFIAQTYNGISYTIPGNYFDIYPSAADWASGNTEDYCFFKAPNGQQLTGSFIGN